MPHPKTVDEYVAKLSPERAEVVNALRALIREVFPDIQEGMSPWGGPTFSVGRGDVAWMGNYSRHTNLLFLVGSQLKSDLLEGSGKNLRHIKVRTPNDINELEYTRLLQEAAKLKPLK